VRCSAGLSYSAQTRELAWIHVYGRTADLSFQSVESRRRRCASLLRRIDRSQAEAENTGRGKNVTFHCLLLAVCTGTVFVFQRCATRMPRGHSHCRFRCLQQARIFFGLFCGKTTLYAEGRAGGARRQPEPDRDFAQMKKGVVKTGAYQGAQGCMVREAGDVMLDPASGDIWHGNCRTTVLRPSRTERRVRADMYGARSTHARSCS
jgi:hypothetical protein